MASLGSKNIDEINDVADMCELLKTLGIYRKGPQTMDGMKRAAKEFLSKDKCAHPKVQVRLISVIRFPLYHNRSPGLLTIAN